MIRKEPRARVIHVFCGDLIPPWEARIQVEMAAVEDVISAGDHFVLQITHGTPESNEFAGAELRTTGHGKNLKSIQALARMLAELRPTIIHSHSFDAAIIAGLAHWLSHQRNIVHIYEIHGAVAFESAIRHSGRWYRWLRYLSIYLLECMAVLFSNRVLLVSDEIAKYYPITKVRKHLSVPRLVRRGTDTVQHSDESLNVFNAFADRAKAAGRKVIVYSGGAALWQLPELTVELMDRLSVELNLAVAIITTEPEVFKQIAARKQHSGKTEWFVDRLKRGSVVEALKCCHIGVLLRDDMVLNRVASPTKLYEYLYAGLAVIATPGVPEAVQIIRQTRAGAIVDPMKLRGGDSHEWKRLREETMRAFTRPQPNANQLRWESGKKRLHELYGIK